MDDELIERISHASIMVAYPDKDRWPLMAEKTKTEHRARSKRRLEAMRKCGLEIHIKHTRVKK